MTASDARQVCVSVATRAPGLYNAPTCAKGAIGGDTTAEGREKGRGGRARSEWWMRRKGWVGERFCDGLLLRAVVFFNQIYRRKQEWRYNNKIIWKVVEPKGAKSKKGFP